MDKTITAKKIFSFLKKQSQDSDDDGSERIEPFLLKNRQRIVMALLNPF